MANQNTIRSATITYWPFAMLVAALLALEFIFPSVLTQRYFRNVYVTDDAGHMFFIFFFLGGISGFDNGNRVRLSFFWLFLILGSLVAAAVADIMFAEVLPRFYLTLSIIIELGGAIFGFALRPGFLAGIRAHIFDPGVSLANRLFRFGLAAILVAAVLFIAICLCRSGEWRVVLDARWRDWPMVVSFAWGLGTGLLWPKPRHKPAIQQSS